MPSRAGLLLLFVVLVAAGAAFWVLIGDDLLFSSAEIEREAREASDAEDLEARDLRLAGQEGAIDAETRAARAAAAAAAAAAARTPDYARAEGVFGTVSDASGRPIADATVHLTIAADTRRTWGVPDPPPVASTQTDSEGGFVVGPAPAGRLRIRAQAVDYAPTVVDVRVRGYRIEVVLDRGGALQVLVKGLEGVLVEGARVIHQADKVITDGVSDANGTVAFPCLPTGAGHLFVAAEGYAGVVQNDVAVTPGRTEVRTVVLGPPLALEGRVLEAQSEVPIAGAQVRLRYPSMPWIESTTPPLSDDDGRFRAEIPLPIGQSMDVQTTASGFAPHRTWHQVTDAGGGRMSLEIKLSRGGEGIRGEVVDHRGRPVAGARVTYVTEQAGQEAPEARSGRDGYFALPPVPWASQYGSRVQIAALSDTEGVGRTYAKIAKEGETAAPTTIRLSGAGSVAGRVLDVAGQPVAGALVSLQVDWSTAARHMQQGGGVRSPWELSTLLSNARYVVLDAVTDAEGRYLLEAVPSTIYLVTAQYGRDRAVSEEPAIVAAGTTVTCVVTLGEGQTIEGYVLDAEGLPVAGAYVSARPEDMRGRGRRSGPSARSQSDGRFTLHGIGRGAHWLRAHASGYQSERQKGVLPGSSGVELVLRPLGWIEGIVTHDGRAFQGTFTVQATYVREESGGNPMLGRSFNGGNGNTFNTDDGTFKLKNLQAGEYDVSVRTPEGLIAPGAVRVRVTDGQGSRASLTLQGGALLKGTLVEDATGEALEGGHISVRAVQGPDAPVTTAHARTDEQGRFIARGLAAGSYVITVYPPSGIQFRELVEIASGETKEVRLRARATGQMRITVRDPGGLLIEGATPRVVDATGSDVWPNANALRRAGIDFAASGWTAMVRTDAAGVNVRYLLPPGRYQVSARKQGYEAAEPRWVEVSSDREATVDVVVRPAGAE